LSNSNNEQQATDTTSATTTTNVASEDSNVTAAESFQRSDFTKMRRTGPNYLVESEDFSGRPSISRRVYSEGGPTASDFITDKSLRQKDEMVIGRRLTENVDSIDYFLGLAEHELKQALHFLDKHDYQLQNSTDYRQEDEEKYKAKKIRMLERFDSLMDLIEKMLPHFKRYETYD